MNEIQERVDAIRYRSSEVENHLIETYRAGRINRREFVRRGTVLGMSVGAIGFLASACGSGDKGGGEATGGGGGATDAASEAAGKVKPGGTVKAGINMPAAAIDPITVADDGGL